MGVGDLWYFASGIPHSIQAISDGGCEFLLAFDDGNFWEFDTFLIADWMAHTPSEVLAKNFGWPASAFENTGPSQLEFLELFRSDRYQDISLAQWISHLPPELVKAHLGIDRKLLESIPKEKQVIVPA